MNHPYINLENLDSLWFQISGTICNIECKHCFNNSSPLNHNFGFLKMEECEKYLEEAVKLGVKEFYFTGGEPLANKEIYSIIEKTMRIGPVTILTNGTLVRPERAKRLADISNNSIYTLEIRVSIDGYTEEMNDAIRGKGVFKRAMRGVKLLYENGFLPTISVTKTWEDIEDDEVLKGFYETLKQHGYLRPRVKILPSLKIGKEKIRTHGYEDYEYVTNEMMTDGFDKNQLICNSGRVVTIKGIYVCPILVNYEDANLGKSLSESMKPYELKHQACYTCYLYGAICSNFSSGRRDA
jgi:MoaA/NifB/PqqE/SkfB family radical SAM enzyme